MGDPKNKPKEAQSVDATDESSTLLYITKQVNAKKSELQDIEKRLATAEKSFEKAENERMSAENEGQRLRDENKSLKEQVENLNVLFDQKNKLLTEKFSAMEKVMEDTASARERVLDALISEREKAIKSINDKGDRLVSAIKSALNEVHESVLKSGDGFGELYAKAVEVAKEKLVSAVSETDRVITSLTKLNDEISEKSKSYVEESVNRRKEAERKLAQWHEEKLAQIEAEIEKTRRENNDKKVSLDSREMNLNLERRSVESQKNALDAYVEIKVDERVGMIERENEDLKNRINELYVEMDEINKEKDDYAFKYRMCEVFDKDQLVKENRTIKAELKEMQSKVIPQELQSDVIAKAKQHEGLKNKLAEALERQYELECDNAELKSLEGLNSFLNVLKDKQSDAIRELREKLDELKDGKVSREYRMTPITKQVFVNTGSDIKDTDELIWLDRIKTGIKSEMFEFSDRLVDAFHTCVKTAIWSPITVLAGVSGTGKSELPRLYSQYGGLLFMNTPVKPDWDSPSSMLGYYNALERKFEARPVLRAMYQMQQAAGGFFNRLSLFLLDEMNLAHVELYFSDMLSKLEENRNKPEEDTAVIDIDLGAGIDSLPINLTRNMLWVGTMNEDETTKGLSDKVVDRSNIIVFPRPKMLKSRELNLKAVKEKWLLDRSTWAKWQRACSELCKKDEFHKATEEYKKTIAMINEHLEKGGRALGHRVWQSIEHYIAACPHVVAGAGEKMDSDENKKNMDKAFAEAVAFKVMPKLRGIETEGKVRKECLDEIKRVVDDKISELSADYSNALNAPYGVFMWKSGEFLEDKKESGAKKDDDAPKEDGSKK